jgi:lysophospholipase L1-like esterase
MTQINPPSRLVKSGSLLYGWPCATRPGLIRGYLPQGQSNGTDTAANYRAKHVTVTKATAIRLVYANENNSGTGSLTGTITLSSAIEITGDVVPVTFGGQMTVPLGPGAMAISDPIFVGFAAGVTFYTRTHVSASAGTVWAFNRYLESANTDAVETGTTTPATTDKTLPGSTTVTSATGHGLVPVAILTTDRQRATVNGIGDSIIIGNSDGISYTDQGFLARACLAGNVPFLNLGRSGESGVNTWIGGTNVSVTLGRRTRAELMAIGDYQVDNYGINDIQNNVVTTLAAMQTGVLARWQSLVDRGLRLYACTVTPKTTSTDSWATTVNQTKALTGAQETLRTQYNDWVRTLPAPLTGYFDTADAVETARNSGIWKAGYAADGLHPNATGHAALAAVIDTSKFV